MKIIRNTIYWTHICILALALLAASIGLFSTSGGASSSYTNQYGNTVILYGDGLYANDSYFKAPILKGADATIVFIIIPLYSFFLIYSMLKHDELSNYMLMGCVSVLLYYSASLAFGVIYNYLHLVYIALFGLTLFTLLYLLSREKTNYEGIKRPFRTIYTFLIITGIGLTVAWLPDIVSSLFNRSSLALIENYTTEITYVLDMGIIAPACFITLRLLQKRKAIGYELLIIILFLCSIVGIMVCLQTVFQTAAGIVLSVGAIITKMGVFVALAIFSATLLSVVLTRAVKLPRSTGR